MPNVRPERTGERDLALNNRHRLWGWDCPMVDIDLLAVEYDRGRPIAIIEYKNEHAVLQHSAHPSYRALVELANRAMLPVFAVRYASNFSWWLVVPLNDAGKTAKTWSGAISEEDYVRWLYRLRNRNPPSDLFPIKSSPLTLAAGGS